MHRIIQALFITSSLALSFSALANCEKCHEKSAKKAECCEKGKHAECKDCKDGKCEKCCKDGQCKHEKRAHRSHEHTMTTAAK